jgi:pentatricopeptide repeat protein
MFARAILGKLPAVATGEGTGKILRMVAEHEKGAHDDTDAAMLQLYERYCVGKDLSNDTEAEKLIVRACLRCNDGATLKQLLGTALDNCKRMSLLRSLATESSMSDVLVVFNAWPRKTTTFYNSMLDLCGACHNMHVAEAVVTAATQDGLADVVTYNTFVKAHLQKGSLKEARKVIDSMREVGLKPNCVTLNELLDAAIKVSVDSAWDIIEDMAVCGVKPNRITCSILLKSIHRNSSSANVTRILAIVDGMDDEIDEVLLSSTIEAILRFGRSDLLAMHLSRLCSAGSMQIKSPHTIGSLIRAHGYVGDIDGVWKTWSDMRKRHITPTSITLGCMVEALVTNGRVDAAYEVLQNAKSSTMQVVCECSDLWFCVKRVLSPETFRTCLDYISGNA